MPRGRCWPGATARRPGGSGLSWREAAAYLPAQVAGCIAGAVIANLMFALTAVSISGKHRATPAHFLSEVIATAGCCW